MKREPKTFRCIKPGSTIYVAIPDKVNKRHFNIKKKIVYVAHKNKSDYGQRNTIFFGSDDYFYAYPNTVLHTDCALNRYSPNLKNLIKELESWNYSYVIKE